MGPAERLRAARINYDFIQNGYLIPLEYKMPLTSNGGLDFTGAGSGAGALNQTGVTGRIEVLLS